MEGMYNMRSPAVKRLMKEAQELREPTEQYEVHPLEDNLFEWHFTIRGPADSDFDGGLYHGRIILPPDYPMKPPSILLLTHNGRFEVNRKICLSISGHHPESWQPSWSIRTALLAIIGFMPTHGAGALGSLDYPTEERKKLAKRSNDYKCPACGCINNILKPVTEESKKTTEEAKELASQIDFKDEKEKNAALKSGVNPESVNSTTANNVTTEETNIPSQPQNIPPQFSPPPFGQFPFRMPFVPPFPMNPQQQTAITNLSQVPRFPLPYTAPLIPPFPPMMHPGNFQMPPMMPPGMAVPPWQQGGMGMTNPSPPQSAPQPTEDQNSRDTTLPNTTSETSTPSVNTVSDYSLASNAGNTQTESNENIVSADSTDMPSATATSSTNETVAQTTPEGVRQRNTTSTTAAPSTTPTPTPRVFQEAHISQANRQSESPAFLLFAVIIIAIITLLLFRRLYSMKYFSLLF